MTHIQSINSYNSINSSDIQDNFSTIITNTHCNTHQNFQNSFTAIQFFSHYFKSYIPHLVAVYIKKAGQYHDLNFFYVNREKLNWEITKRRLNDEVFFRELYQHYAVSRNEFIEKLDMLEEAGSNKKECSIEVPNCSKYIDYVVINNLEQYLKNNI